jgi:glycosyltransferase involved in cell wall biosynthesis
VKILFDHSLPFALAHGGVQIQIEQTKLALEKVGIEVEYLRWWDASQRGDILHYFGRPSSFLTSLAQQKGMKVVLADLLTAQGSRPPWAHRLHRAALRILQRTLPPVLSSGVTSGSYRLADACLALSPWEAHLMRHVFGAPTEKVHVVPNGVELAFFDSPRKERGKWLVCTATITPRKRILELAQAAVKAGTPVRIIGKPYSDADPYHWRFLDCAQAHRDLVSYEGPTDDRAKLAVMYREARGFVLLSTMESLSLSALEAAACECPLLLSDLPWARETFGNAASYCPVTDSVAVTAKHLRRFHDRAPELKLPAKPRTWLEIAEQLKGIYASL